MPPDLTLFYMRTVLEVHHLTNEMVNWILGDNVGFHTGCKCQAIPCIAFASFHVWERAACEILYYLVSRRLL